MRRKTLLGGAVLLALGAVAGVGAARFADDKKPGEPSFQKLKLDADDIAEFAGLDLYKFALDLPEGQKFQVVLREVDAAGAVIPGNKSGFHHKFDFKKTKPGPAVLTVGFLRDDHSLDGFLLGVDTKKATLRLGSPQCEPNGVGATVELPLPGVSADERFRIVWPSTETAKLNKLKPLQLITVSAAAPGKPFGPAAESKRAEVVVELID